VDINAARSDPPTPRLQATGRAAQQRERDRVALAKERKIRRQERLDQHDKNYQLREQQGLPLPPAGAGELVLI
jgi:hypothetical protein